MTRVRFNHPSVEISTVYPGHSSAWYQGYLDHLNGYKKLPPWLSFSDLQDWEAGSQQCFRDLDDYGVSWRRYLG